MAKEGGVLRRAGHTEAAVDLARMAGLRPAGVLCEILDADGDRPRRDAALCPGPAVDLEIISIEQLIRHRRRSEKLVYRLAEAELPTRFGPGRIIVYGVRYEEQQPMAIVLGDLASRPRRWSGCIRRASPATCWPRSAATAATSSAWPWR